MSSPRRGSSGPVVRRTGQLTLDCWFSDDGPITVYFTQKWDPVQMTVDEAREFAAALTQTAAESEALDDQEPRYRALDLQPRAAGVEVLLAVPLNGSLVMPVVCLAGNEAGRLYNEGRLDGWKPVDE